ncbi:amidohydrolase [Rapidithrix thailandica]|uniref:Amidohydrolase n=1 Tax=Rapidithrix thailandica TaxID=413964 RepID=A0AAW9S2G4_9BACT
MMKQIIPILLLLSALFSCEPKQTFYDMVIYNGIVYTLDEEQPQAEAVAVEDGKIVFVGSNEEVQAFIGDSTQVLDLQGKTLLPGLIDAHAHLMGIGENRIQLDLSQVKSYEELVEMVKKKAGSLKPGEWVLGRGWHQDKWMQMPEPSVKGFPVHELLSAASPDNPVFLRHASGHAGLANQKAMEEAGLIQLTAQEIDALEGERGEIIRDGKGKPTGIFNETAMEAIASHIPTSSAEYYQKVLQLAIEECLANGITSLHDAGVGPEVIELYKKQAAEGQLDMRLYVMLDGSNEELLKQYFQSGPELNLGQGFLDIRSIKLFADGALGSRGAWLLEPYDDRHEHSGHAVTPMEEIGNIAKKGFANGFQVCTHAIGDRANREVLNLYEEAFRQSADASEDHRFRIEHAQHISIEDIPRFAELGVIPSVQAIHMSSDRPWAIDRLGTQRIEEGAYVWQKLLQSGAKVINGTDAPVEPVNPMACFYAAVTRKTLKGEPEGGYEPGQKMTREQALKTYTLEAAYGAFQETWKGSVEVGKVADFTILSQDIMKVPEEDILNTKVAYTIVDGKIVFERKE